MKLRRAVLHSGVERPVAATRSTVATTPSSEALAAIPARSACSAGVGSVHRPRNMPAPSPAAVAARAASTSTSTNFDDLVAAVGL